MTKPTRSPRPTPSPCKPWARRLERVCQSASVSTSPSARFRHATASGNDAASRATNSGCSTVMLAHLAGASVGGAAFENDARVVYQHGVDGGVADAAGPHDREHLVGNVRPTPIARVVRHGAGEPVDEAHGVVREDDPLGVAAG